MRPLQPPTRRCSWARSLTESEDHLGTNEQRRSPDERPVVIQSESTMSRQGGVLARWTGIWRLVVARLRRHRHLHGSWAKTMAHFCRVIAGEGIRGLSARAEQFKGGGFDYKPVTAEAYQRWIAKFDTLGDAQRAHILDDVAAWSDLPVISIALVLPGAGSEAWQTIDSIVRQIYPNWTLTLVVAAGAQQTLEQLAQRYANQDGRVSIIAAPEGIGEEASLNLAFEHITGRFVAFATAGDTYAPDAFYLVARQARQNQAAVLFYGDTDVASESGARRWPFFKPEWDPLLILGLDFVSDCAFLSSDAVRRVSALRAELGDAARYDLVLRLACGDRGAQVVHIPRVMMHLAPDGTAGRPFCALAQGAPQIAQDQDSALEAYIHSATVAVSEQLARTGTAAAVASAFPGLPLRRVTYPIPRETPHVTIIVPTRDGLSLLRRCIGSVLGKTTYPRYDVLIVDNGSADPATLAYFEELGRDPRITVLRDDRPFNFSALNNRAARQSSGEFLCLLNNDVEVISPDWLDVMVGLGVQPGVGSVGACLWYPDDTLQHGGVLLGYGGVAGHLHHMLARGQAGYFGRAVVNQRLSAVTAACLLVRKTVYEKVGGLDEHLAVAFNDIDFCIRVLRAGYTNVWTPDAHLYHFESASRGTDMAPEKFARFQSEVRTMRERWGSVLDADSAYNPNLNLNSALPQFALSDSPRIAQHGN